MSAPDPGEARRPRPQPEPSRPEAATADATPDATQREPPHLPQGSGGRERQGSARDDDPRPAQAPGERARLEEAVQPVAQGGGMPWLVVALVTGAFVLALVRPWDWLVGPLGAAPGGHGQPAQATDPLDAGPTPTLPGAPAKALTCAYPTSWRTATIESWSGRQVRVWTAAIVAPALRPDDPAVAFQPVIAEAVTAIGWCAPVDGPDRPPPGARGELFRITGGIARPAPFLRLEPNEADPLGELWVTPAQAAGRRAPWPPGRYVIRIATPTGSYVRYLGLEVRTSLVPSSIRSPAPTATAPTATAPAATAPRATAP